ncbi:hypothetical protein NQ315_007359 [Exocentrus adspersus]|uniref:Secreted protein n=1 Tax=Exocentrus adspersus TaxID=1586481 RepID=A0AAV8VI31_9CUCU|nr:hypothetical protein NQ315_007359 [Exocentrus adspersus]
MRCSLVFVVVLFVVFSTAYCAPAEQTNVSSDAKSAFGVAFDEIVVDTSLTVKRKDPARLSRSQSASQGGAAASVVPQKKQDGS